MNNFIRNIKNHKKAALICLAVVAAVAAAAVLAVKLSGSSDETSSSSSDASQSEDASASVSYFTDSDFPVTVSARGQSALISLSGEDKWEHSCSPSGIVSEQTETGEENSTVLVLSPMKVGYASLKCRQTGKLGSVSFNTADICADVTVYADENGAMRIRVDNLRLSTASSGAGDSATPYVIAENRVIFPNGGDWTLTVEADGEVPEGLYLIMPGTDDEGHSYIEVSMDSSLMINDKGEIDMNAVTSRLLLRSESLGIEKRLNCTANPEKEWILTEAGE